MVDSISRIASALESARVITLEAAAVASSKLGESSYTHYSKGITPEQLRTLLNSRNSREIKDGMKRIIAIMSSGDGSMDVESYFADVIKNIISNDMKIKILVCIYLLRFAEKDPNLALLSINSLQKTISDGDPEVRALSIKALSDIKIPSLYPIVLHTLKKVVADTSATVRNEVSFALLKLYVAKAEEMEDDIVHILQDLLADADPMVLSSAILVLKECFPDKLEWLHGHFRYYCKIMPNLDSWAQSYLITLLLSYCKVYIPRPTIVDASGTEDSQNTMQMPEKCNEIRFPVYDVINDGDLALFLACLERLVFRSNPAVILSASNAFFQLATPMQFKKSRFPEAIIRVCSLSSNRGLLHMVFQSVLLFSSVDPTLFLPYMKKFFILPSDDTTIACLKLKILSTMVNESNIKSVVKEFKYYISYQRAPTVSIAAANALAVCARLSPGWESNIMKWFISHMENSKLSKELLGSYINVIRVLAQENPKRHLRHIMKLSGILENQNSLADNARAAIVWLFGEIITVEFRICPDILRKLIPTFTFEGPETRCQILLLAAKLVSYDIDSSKSNSPETPYSFETSRIGQMYKAVSYLAEFDEDFDVRDRARCISSLFDSGKFEIATLLFQAPKPTPKLDLVSSSAIESKMPIYQADFTSLGLEKSILDFHKFIPWGNGGDQFDEDLRVPAPLKDYTRYKKSFSSDSFNGRSLPQVNTPSTSSPMVDTVNSLPVVKQERKYRLQSLDEFFMDIPSNPGTKSKKRIVIEETSSEDETDDETDDESDNYSEESGEGNDSEFSNSSSGSSGSGDDDELLHGQNTREENEDTNLV